ncbi:MAG: hypothetical protein LBK99_06480 [Opitutaceae bacterium]|jgi:hypothetical protein|nr:hypothetical protein [Opitutaceae bacterium]
MSAQSKLAAAGATIDAGAAKLERAMQAKLGIDTGASPLAITLIILGSAAVIGGTVYALRKGH